jgi:hypothetical protein
MEILEKKDAAGSPLASSVTRRVKNWLLSPKQPVHPNSRSNLNRVKPRRAKLDGVISLDAARLSDGSDKSGISTLAASGKRDSP